MLTATGVIVLDLITARLDAATRGGFHPDRRHPSRARSVRPSSARAVPGSSHSARSCGTGAEALTEPLLLGISGVAGIPGVPCPFCVDGR